MVDDFLDARTAALGGLFDNAAIFPPASRSLADALTAHRGHQQGDRGWLVRRLLIRASQAVELVDLLDSTDDLELGVVLDRTAGGPFATAVDADVAGLATVSRDRRVRLTGLEVMLEGADPEGEVAAVLASLQGARLPADAGVAVEVAVAGASAGDVLRGVSAIAAARAAGGSDANRLMAKVRCGGIVPSAIPADVEVAGFLRACAKDQMPFKATAGLHHPTRTRDMDHGGLQHGFLNLLAAAAAAFSGAKLDVIHEHLARPPEDFKLGPGAMIVGTDVVEGKLLDRVRRQFLTGIGCCDILDPITDLAKMGVVNPTGGLV